MSWVLRSRNWGQLTRWEKPNSISFAKTTVREEWGKRKITKVVWVGDVRKEES